MNERRRQDLRVLVEDTYIPLLTSNRRCSVLVHVRVRSDKDLARVAQLSTTNISIGSIKKSLLHALDQRAKGGIATWLAPQLVVKFRTTPSD